jgi:apolipoprotein N-acyltransferase
LSWDAPSGKLGRVNGLVPNLSERGRLALAAAGGLLLAAAFPKLGVAGMAWVAPGVMLLAAWGARSPFRVGYVGGLAYQLAALHWLLFIPVRFFPILGWLAMGGVLAFYPAIWCWVCVRMQGGGRQSDGAVHLAGAGGDGDRRDACPTSLEVSDTWLGGQGWALSCAAAWVAVEMAQARLFTGFPWDLLGVSQYRMLPLIQISSLTGVYGLSFVMVWFSASFLLLLRALWRQPARRWGWQSHLLVPGLAVVFLYAWGAASLGRQPRPDRFLQVALVQPSIPQTMIWNDAESATRFQQVLKVSEQALATKPDLLIWPEAATPKLLRFDRDIHEAVTNLVRSHRVWLLLGADDAEPREGKEPLYYNSSFLISPEGELVARYRKRHLVMFGEYIPLVRWLPFIKWFTPIDSGFEPGDAAVPFTMPALGAATSPLICFEDVFADLARASAGPDIDFLVNLTNDGWFGEGAAQWQQAANAVFRAVENGLPLVRCANNGLTCWIDAGGGMHEVYFAGSKDIYQAGFKTAAIPLRSSASPRRPTFYHRHGDWFGWACVVVTAASLALAIRRRKPLVRPTDASASTPQS